MAHPYERYRAFMKGFRDANKGSFVDSAFDNHRDVKLKQDYHAGYTHGYRIQGDAERLAVEHSGYKPSIFEANELLL